MLHSSRPVILWLQKHLHGSTLAEMPRKQPLFFCGDVDRNKLRSQRHKNLSADVQCQVCIFWVSIKSSFAVNANLICKRRLSPVSVQSLSFWQRWCPLNLKLIFRFAIRSSYFSFSHSRADILSLGEGWQRSDSCAGRKRAVDGIIKRRKKKHTLCPRRVCVCDWQQRLHGDFI